MVCSEPEPIPLMKVALVFLSLVVPSPRYLSYGLLLNNGSRDINLYPINSL